MTRQYGPGHIFNLPLPMSSCGLGLQDLEPKSSALPYLKIFCEPKSLFIPFSSSFFLCLQ